MAMSKTARTLFVGSTLLGCLLVGILVGSSITTPTHQPTSNSNRDIQFQPHLQQQQQGAHRRADPSSQQSVNARHVPLQHRKEDPSSSNMDRPPPASKRGASTRAANNTARGGIIRPQPDAASAEDASKLLSAILSQQSRHNAQHAKGTAGPAADRATGAGADGKTSGVHDAAHRSGAGESGSNGAADDDDVSQFFSDDEADKVAFMHRNQDGNAFKDIEPEEDEEEDDGEEGKSDWAPGAGTSQHGEGERGHLARIGTRSDEEQEDDLAESADQEREPEEEQSSAGIVDGSDASDPKAAHELALKRLRRIDSDPGVVALKAKIRDMAREPLSKSAGHMLKLLRGADPSRTLATIISGGSNSSKSRSPIDEVLHYQVHKLRAINRNTILDTWGPDVLFVTHERVNTENVMRLPSAVEYSGRHGLPLKVRAMWGSIFERHMDPQYEFFLKADDDTFVHRTRLTKLLHTFNPHVPMIIGRKAGGPTGFCHGGGGYVLSRGLLDHIGPHLHDVCRDIDMSHSWEDMFMRECIARIMSLGGRGWETCTSQVFMGFDTLYFNTKNQTLNAQRFSNALEMDRPWVQALTTFHSVHAQLALTMDNEYRTLDADKKLVKAADHNMLLQVYRRLRAAAWRCDLPTSKPSEMRAALCVSPLPRVRIERFLFNSDICLYLPGLRTAISTTPLLPVSTPFPSSAITTANDNDGDTTAQQQRQRMNGGASEGQQRNAVLTYVAFGRKATSKRFLTVLVKSLRESGSNADVIIAVAEGDLDPQLSQLAQEHQNVAVVIYDRQQVQNTHSHLAEIPASYVSCVWSAILQQVEHKYSHVLTTTMDTYFQRDPFVDVVDRGGVAHFLTSPTMTYRSHDYGGWIADVKTQAPRDYLRPKQCSKQRDCLEHHIAVNLVLMMGTSTAVKKSLTAVNHLIVKERKTYRQAFTNHVRLRYAARMFLNATLYNSYDGPAVCLAADRCLFEHNIEGFLRHDLSSRVRFGPSGRLVVNPDERPVVVNARGDVAAIVSGYASAQRNGYRKFVEGAKRRGAEQRKRDAIRRAKNAPQLTF